MKTVALKASITAIALTLGVCSFATLPTGRALNGKEKKSFRGREPQPNEYSCKVCTPGKGGTDCNYDSFPKPGEDCATRGGRENKCTGFKGDGSVLSALRDIVPKSTNTETCEREYYICWSTDPVKKPSEQVWIKEPSVSWGDCGQYSTCGDKDTETPIECQRRVDEAKLE